MTLQVDGVRLRPQPRPWRHNMHCRMSATPPQHAASHGNAGIARRIALSPQPMLQPQPIPDSLNQQSRIRTIGSHKTVKCNCNPESHLQEGMQNLATLSPRDHLPGGCRSLHDYMGIHVVIHPPITNSTQPTPQSGPTTPLTIWSCMQAVPCSTPGMCAFSP